MSELPADFDPAEYLRMHKDVAAAKLDAAHHYINHGRAEGRPYKENTAPAPIEKLGTMVLTKPDLFKERLGKETLLVTGSSRGATSLVAYVLIRMGYPLRSDQPINHEMLDMIAAIDNTGDLLRIIARENEQATRWGFKLPAAALKLDWYVSNLRRPVILMVYRNALAIARSVQKHEPTWDQGEAGIRSALRHAERYLSAIHGAANSPAPAILLDVDAAQRKPEAFIRDLASLFGLSFSEDIAAEISTPGYKQVSPKSL